MGVWQREQPLVDGQQQRQQLVRAADTAAGRRRPLAKAGLEEIVAEAVDVEVGRPAGLARGRNITSK